MKKPAVFTDNKLLDFSSKKVRKLYGIVPEKWFSAKKITEEDFAKSEDNFKKLTAIPGGDLVALASCLEDSREYIQIMFRTEDPSAHVQKLKSFWGMPNGLHVLTLWFEWICGGSDSGNIGTIIELKMDENMQIIEKVLIDQNCEEYENELKDAEKKFSEDYGNGTMYNIHLLRQLCKSFKNHPEKLLYIEGKDKLKDASQQPFLHILQVQQHGVGEYDKSLVISVRVGSTVIFEDVTLCQGLAAILQVTFAFNLLYDSNVDDMYNYLQRILAKFGPMDGARNKKNHVKKNFVDFQCTLGKLVLEQKRGNVLKICI